MTTKLANGRQTLQRQTEVYLASAALSADDEAALDRLWLKTSRLVRGSDVAAHLHSGAHLIVDGWACQMRETRQGRRQILSFLLPGDLIGSPHPHAAPPCRVVALTRLATLPLSVIAAPAARSSAAASLTDAAHKSALLSQHWIFNHVERLGGRDAYRAVVHLFLELNERLARVGLAREGVFPLPIGRRILAQALGLSLAHTHQMIKRLSLDGLLKVDGGSIRLLDGPELARVADFAPVEPHASTTPHGREPRHEPPQPTFQSAPPEWAQSLTARSSAAFCS